MTPPRRRRFVGAVAILVSRMPATQMLRVCVALALGLVPLGAVRLATPTPVMAAACGIPTCTLTILSQGNGSGSWVTTNSSHVPNGFIDCQMVNGVRTGGSVCSHVYGGEDRATPLVIYYTITPAIGSIGCSISLVCTNSVQYGQVTMTSDYQVIEKFTLETFGVVADTAGPSTGTGTIVSSPAGISCPNTCSKSFDYGTNVTLTATPNAGSYFNGWTGPCAGQDETCSFTVTDLVLSYAYFMLGSPPTPSPSPGTTPHATPVATPKASKPPTTAAPGSTLAPPAESSAPAATDPGATNDDIASIPIATTVQPTDAGLTAAPVTEPPTTPTGASSPDLTPIALAILGAGLLIAIGIGVAAYVLRRRPAPPA